MSISNEKLGAIVAILAKNGYAVIPVSLGAAQAPKASAKSEPAEKEAAPKAKKSSGIAERVRTCTACGETFTVGSPESHNARTCPTKSEPAEKEAAPKSAPKASKASEPAGVALTLDDLGFDSMGDDDAEEPDTDDAEDSSADDSEASDGDVLDFLNDWG